MCCAATRIAAHVLPQTQHEKHEAAELTPICDEGTSRLKGQSPYFGLEVGHANDLWRRMAI